jgi:hypothetical protein
MRREVKRKLIAEADAANPRYKDKSTEEIRKLKYRLKNNESARRCRERARSNTDPEEFAKGRHNDHLTRKYKNPDGSPFDRHGYEKMLSAQGGHCALCDRTPTQYANGVLHVDHCHDTMKVRGVLCPGCNTSLGHLGDDIPGLVRALAYLVMATGSSTPTPADRNAMASMMVTLMTSSPSTPALQAGG